MIMSFMAVPNPLNMHVKLYRLLFDDSTAGLVLLIVH